MLIWKFLTQLWVLPEYICDIKNNLMAETTKTRKQVFLEGLKGRNPELDMNDEEALYGAIGDEYASANERLKRFEDESSRLLELFSNDPVAGELFTQWAKGANPVLLLVEQYGDDFKAALEDPEMAKSVAERHKKWLERVAENRRLEDEANANLKETFDTLERLQSENGWSDEETQKIFEQANRIFMDGLVNRIAPETFIMISKAMNFDSAVRDAETTGEVRGRNAQIEERLRRDAAPSGMPPTLTGRGGDEPERRPQRAYNPFRADNGEYE